MDKRILSSSSSGYIIIPRLTDGTYLLVIGFPRNEWPEFTVSVNVKDTNAGFLLRNVMEKGWAILNFEGVKSRMAEKQSTTNEVVTVVSSSDEFARVLAAVVNDPSIAETVVVKKTTEPPIEKPELKMPEVKIVEEELKPVLVDKNFEVSTDKMEISKLDQDSTSEGLLITYLDVVNTSADTVKVFMPVGENAKVVVDNKEQPEKLLPLQKKENVGTANSRFIDMELQNPNARIDSGVKKIEDFVVTQKKDDVKNISAVVPDTAGIKGDTSKGMINSDCKKAATHDDFMELRKQMAAESTEKAMIKTANKQFVKTCFTTEQVKNLGVLFIAEEEKYKFFVAAFPFVSDSHNFKILEDQLADNYYKTRFKAMLGR